MKLTVSSCIHNRADVCHCKAPTLVATAGKRAKLTASTSTSKKGVKGTTTKKIPNKSEGKPADERDSSPSSHKKRTSKLRDTRPPRNGNEDSLKTTNPSPSDNTATDLEAVDQIVSKTTSDIEPASAEDEEVEEEEEEDHAAKLLRGFESDSSNDEDEQVGPVDVSNLPEIPDTAKALQRLKVSGDGPGVIYIG